MDEPSHALARLLEAYREWAGEPVSISSYRRDADARFPSELDVLCFQAPEEDRRRPEDDFTFLTTAGLSARPSPGTDVPIELYWHVAGHRSPEEVKALAGALAVVAALPSYHPVRFVPGAVIRGVTLPLFERMSCLLVTNWTAQGEEWLPETDPPVLILAITALYESEADVIEEAKLDEREALEWFRGQGINPSDPARSPAARAGAGRRAPPGPSAAKEEEGAPEPGASVEERVRRAWRGIEEWYQKSSLRLVESLRPPIPEEDLVIAEERLGFPMPEGYKASLRIHDGGGELHDYTYVRLDWALQIWSELTEPSDRGEFAGRRVDSTYHGVIKDVWWHRGYLPFAQDGGGNLICIDLDPGLRGERGQIVKMELRAGPYPTGVRSFEDWLEQYRDQLYAGAYVVNAEGLLVEKNET